MKENFKKLISNKFFLIALIALIIIILGIGFTYAWLTWQSEKNTKFTLSIDTYTDVLFSGGNEINATGIGPVVSEDQGEIMTFQILKKNDTEVPISVTFTPTTLPDALKEESFKYKLYSSTSLNGNYSLVAEGNFSNKVQGTNFVIGNVGVSETTYFKLIFYIDGNMLNPSTMKNQTLAGTVIIKGNYNICTAKEVTPNSPSLAEGMIPIKWNGTNWVKADSTNSNNDWYDYSSKKWANVVMVKDSSRSKYMSAATGTTITESDVLAYYVWIPRYKYQLFNVNSEKIDPIEICMQFEPSTETKSTGSNNEEWLTHPAFTFGDKELTGIWVGKFETSGTASAPTIKAGLDSLVNQNVSTQFATSQKFTSGTTYLTHICISKVDAHMMKNTEWGAVAYLKQSKYGLGLTDIGDNAYNNNYQFKAGCGPASETDLTSKTTTCTSYTSTAGVKSSTTGNIYGVYDMAGGASEYVMGVVQDNTNTSTPMSGYSTSSNSGFTGKVYASGNYTSYTGTAFPSSKYYDLYDFGTTNIDSSAYARRILGDATSETRGWYSDNMYIAYAEHPWFDRGGSADDGAWEGVFYANMYVGSPHVFYSFRSVLTPSA